MLSKSLTKLGLTDKSSFIGEASDEIQLARATRND